MVFRRIALTFFVFLTFLTVNAQVQDTVSSLKGLVIDEAVVSGKGTIRENMMKLPQNVVAIDRSYLDANISGSLMQSLSNIPGVKAMNIGSGESKPAIRGMGFNRMVVTENGIKHEGQQWGEEHGLEIDQFDIDKIEVIKGPAALLYGSDAIGGVINLYNNYLPINKFEGKLNIVGRSNNESIGISAKVAGRNSRFYYKAHLTYIDYADFRVPTDSIQYYSYYIKLKDRRLRNTAGRETDGSVTIGYVGERFKTEFRISDINNKSGFFADAHGLEVRQSQIDYNHSRRDVDLPYHSVNHFKLVNHTASDMGGWHLLSDLSYQNNLRNECSEPVSHGYMPVPPDSLERSFNKHTLSWNIGLKKALKLKHEVSGGLNFEFQNNRRGGWSFIIPDFETLSLGLYLFDRYKVSSELIFNGGIRYDGILTSIHQYSDWYKTPQDGIMVNKMRADELYRAFNSLTWSFGMNYNIGEWVFKANIGKGFRAPIAKELGTDGINYHIFRYEKGNSTLDAEKSYQLDAGINWSSGRFDIRFEPYVNYFPNYIYLSPTSSYIEGLQKYVYTQSQVFRWGFEFQTAYKIVKNLEAVMKGEYLYSVQLSGDKKGYTLPFSPPWSGALELKYTLPYTRGNAFAAISCRIVGTQREIVPPEVPTDGYGLVDLSIGKKYKLKDCTLSFNLSVDNILNKKYYDHTSFYRLIDVPGPGRNLTLLLGVVF